MRDCFTRTALHSAVLSNSLEFVEFLLSNGSDTSILDENGDDPASISIIKGSLPIVKSIFPKYKKIELRYCEIACKNDKGEILQYLLGYVDKNKANESDSKGKGLVHFASKLDNPNLIDILFSFGLSLDLQDASNGWSPIFYAANAGNLNTLKRLVELGADTSFIDESGASPAYYAFYEGYTSCVDYLVDLGCDIELRTPSISLFSLPSPIID